MSLKKFLAPIAAAAALALVPAASQAGLIIQITDGVNTLNVADGSALDGVAGSGAVGYFGAFGGQMFTIGFGTGTSNPLQMHLGAIVAGIGGPLWIRLTQTDLVAGADPTPFTVLGGGAGASGAQASWAAYVDDSNAAFGTDQLIFGTTGFATAGGAQMASLSGTYSVTLVTRFDHSGISNYWGAPGSSLDLNLVPEPASLALFGLGLLGLGVARRRNA